MNPVIFDTVQSPLGDLLLAANHDGLTHLLFTPLHSSYADIATWVASDNATDAQGALDRASGMGPAWPGNAGHATYPANAAALATAHVQLARVQLAEYFAGTRHTFTVLLAATGTAFQRSVWQALVTVPYGQTRSYGDVAREIGRPKAMRAVGLANGRNPISIIVPCHRVIGANGSLTGYGGGLARKQQLLALETGAALSSFVAR